MIDLDRIRGVRDLAALMVFEDEIYAPIFERLDREVIAREKNDPVARARVVVMGGMK